MALTDAAIRNTKPQSKPVKLADGGGLHLLVTPAGGIDQSEDQIKEPGGVVLSKPTAFSP
jgi:hypothetical protein